MIIDTLANAGKYVCVHPLFRQSFAYLMSCDLEAIGPGEYEIEPGRLRAIVSNDLAVPAGGSAARLECHNKHIDIQLCIKGIEQIGWKPRSGCTGQDGDYDESKDVIFYHDKPDMYLELRERQFVVFFPEDVHAPMMGEGRIKKLVLKVRI
jgi:YhcH/YjgK/YiaL family protein